MADVEKLAAQLSDAQVGKEEEEDDEDDAAEGQAAPAGGEAAKLTVRQLSAVLGESGGLLSLISCANSGWTEET